MKVSFRNESRRALGRAKAELDAMQQDRLKYAALELRMAMEALTYDRANAYKAEIPPNEYETWQPRKVMQLLLEIDPNADKNSTIRIGAEDEHGKPADNMQTLGSEEVLNLKTIKKYYDALGSYLHMPILKKINNDSHHDFDKLRAKCDEIYFEVEKALSSSVFNSTIGDFASISCMRCGEMIRRRLPLGVKSVDAKCFKCGASYEVLDEGDDNSKWFPEKQKVDCPTESCDAILGIWKDDIKAGSRFKCDDCGEEFIIGLTIFKMMRNNQFQSPIFCRSKVDAHKNYKKVISR